MNHSVGWDGQQFILQHPLKVKVLRQLIVAGLIDHVAVRKDVTVKDSGGTKFANAKNIPYVTLDVDDDVFIHPSSILFNGPPPDYVVYQDIIRTSRVWIKCK